MRRSRRSASTGERLWAEVCARGFRLGLAAALLTGMAAVGRALWQEEAARRADRWQAPARQTASRVSRSWWTALFNPAAHHAATVQASAPSRWNKRPADAFVPPAHPLELSTPGVIAPRSKMDTYVPPARVADLSRHRPDARDFNLGVLVPAGPVALNRQPRTTAGSSPDSFGVSAPRKAFFSASVAGAKPQVAAALDLYVDSTDPGQANEYYAGSSYSVPAGSPTYGNAYVGYNGMGTVTQAGNSLTVSSTLSVGDNAGSNGKYSLQGGNLSTGTAIIGNNGMGTFTQSGGTFTTNSSDFFLGLNSGSSGSYTLSGTGSLSTGNAVVGYSGTGIFMQSGGTFTTNDNPFFVGGTPGSSGSYTLSGTGSLSTGGAVVGYEAGGTFTQSGGTFTTNGSELYLGELPGGNGTYNLSGGSLTTGLTQVSYNANTSSFTQSGGLHTTGTLDLSGESTSSNGTYSLQGGTLNVGTVMAGADSVTGTSTFNFNGGTLQASQNTTSFLQGLTTANVQSGGATGTAPGGAIIDTNGYNVTIAQNLVHDTTAGAPATDGGLTVLDSAGGGTLTLTGANTYTGPTTLASGVLNVGSAGALGNTSQINFNGGTLQYSSANQTDYSGVFSTANNQAYNIDTNGQSVTFATGLTSSGGSLTVLDSAGEGTLTLSGANTYTGYTTVDGGTLAVAAGGSITGSSLLTVDATGASPAAVTLVSGSSLSAGTALIGVFGTGSVTQSGGSFTNGSTLYLGYYPGSSGTYNLNGGVLTTGSVAGVDGASTFNFNGGTLQAGASSPNFFSGVGTAEVQAGGAIIDTQGYNVTVAQNLVSGVNTSKPTAVTSAVAPTTDGGLTKLGTGTLTLTGTSSYTGPTNVNAGTLAVNGSLTGTGMLTVNSGATLAGSGSVAGTVMVNAGGTLAPGTGGTDRLTLGSSLTLAGTSTASFTLGGTTAGTGYTQLYVGGALTLGGSTLNVSVATGFTLAVNQTFFLIDRTGTDLSQIGTFGNAPGRIYTDAAGDTFLVNYLAVDPANGDLLPNDLSLTVLSVVPEPSTWALLGVGFAGLGLACHRQRRLRAQSIDGFL